MKYYKKVRIVYYDNGCTNVSLIFTPSALNDKCSKLPVEFYRMNFVLKNDKIGQRDKNLFFVNYTS